MAADRSPGERPATHRASDPDSAEDRARPPRPTREGSATHHASSPRLRDEREGTNSIRLHRARERTGEEPRAGAPSAAKEAESRAARDGAAPAASAAKPAGSSASVAAD